MKVKVLPLLIFLVSGFNCEYRRGGFALIFLYEYARILI